MTSGFALADVPGGTDRPPEERGTLSLNETAVAHVLEGAALGAPGSATRAALLGRGYPKARATVKHGRIWASIDVGVRWPGPTADTARGIARRVREEAARITGLDVAALDLTVHLVDSEDGTERRVK
ncbi:hypothetical protein AB0B28_10295 [Glycomyces sp. NPDC046736]|uniref:hypothetical protein n=1 Tax=Glycomyces sp. NPDC046736 TaxID=3155615 RepID=UPI0033FB8D26